jgi:ATP phosphoribosyltransferase-like protein
MKDVIALLPDALAPTISPLADPDWVDIMVVVQESFVRDLLPPSSTKSGARGIIEMPLKQDHRLA